MCYCGPLAKPSPLMPTSPAPMSIRSSSLNPFNSLSLSKSISQSAVSTISLMPSSEIFLHYIDHKLLLLAFGHWLLVVYIHKC